MAGGSQEPESDDDQQCSECGLWFASGGVQSHEKNCDWQGVERRIVPLECPHALLRAGELDPTRAPETPDVEDVVEDEEFADDLRAEATVEVADDPGGDPGGDPGTTPMRDPSSARTDGGPMAVPTFADDGDDEVVEESDDGSQCESCGGTNIEDPAKALPDEALESRPEVAKFDYICIDCSTDDNGTWTNPVQVFNA